MTAVELDPDLADVLAAFPEGVDPGDHIGDMNVVRLLRSTMDVLAMTGGTLPTDDRVRVHDRSIPGPAGAPEVPVRIYSPVAAGTARPGVVFFHGGAFILGDVYTEELRCLRYAAEAGCVVVSVGYRLAPEDPFPAGFDDCYSALVWVAEHRTELGIDGRRLAVGGTSAGGGLAASVALRARDAGGPALALQLLVYPTLDARMGTPSMHEFTSTPGWNSVANHLMWSYYLDGSGPASAYASPALAEALTGLPPAAVVVAAFDPLRDEAVEYALTLVRAGVSTELHLYPGTFHAFDAIAPFAAISQRALEDQVLALRRALRR